ncbi:MAG TPA: trypsin-like peptidase domain-containing protein [Pyrinomonadaceae bacterium]|nr:trypsin-like peptidase domain-containing protein [Pyrinomonadaceae bacterium]
MSNKAMYQLSARQILFLALASAFITAGTVIALSNFGSVWQARDMANIALAEYAPTAISEPSTVTDEQNSIEVYKTLAPGVVAIKTSARVANYYGEEFERESGNGSGSVIDNQGHILTNSHVVEGASALSVSFGGDKVYPAKVIGRDPDTDLAVIKIEPPREGLTVISLGDSDRLNVGQKVLAIGNPFGLDRTLTTGVISGLQRPIRGTNNRPIEGAIQTDASINPGNSGGPLLDKYGKMIGINSQIYSRNGTSSGVGFAIPVNIAKRVVPQLIQFGEVRRPKLGASLLSVEQLSGQVQLPVASGLLVRSALAGGAAANSGIRGLSQDATGEVVLGDIITAVDGEKMKELDDLYRYLDKKQIGDTVQAQVFRDGRTLTIPVKLTSPPQQSPDRQTRRY